jgi:hypothetical protein
MLTCEAAVWQSVRFDKQKLKRIVKRQGVDNVALEINKLYHCGGEKHIEQVIKDVLAIKPSKRI